MELLTATTSSSSASLPAASMSPKEADDAKSSSSPPLDRSDPGAAAPPQSQNRLCPRGSPNPAVDPVVPPAATEEKDDGDKGPPTTVIVRSSSSSSSHDSPVKDVDPPSSPSTDPPMASPKKRGSGWGIPPGLGLRGGADTMTNGASGWGPPPAGAASAPPPGAAPGAPAGGWGSAPPPNPSASAAWGTPNSPGGDDSANKSGSGKPMPPPAVATATSSSASASGATPQSSQQQQQQQQSTSWAAAAGKGLPASTNANGSFCGGNAATASKQLEQLNSVREALFSQDGWGGSNVKQDTSWDLESRPNGQESLGGTAASAANSAAAPAAAAKEVTLWVGGNGNQRNDGTDLWKTTLSGQPPASKPQPSNPWGHTPQNPADYKNWGEDDEHASSNSSNNETFWRPDQPSTQFNKPQADGWRNESRGGAVGTIASTAVPTGPSWNEPSHPLARENMQPDPSIANSNNWGAPPNSSSSQRQQANPGQWGNGPSAAPAARWDHDSPTMTRRPHPQMEDTAGTSLWGGKGGGIQAVQNPGNASKWQDMPNMPRGPPGPPRMMGGGGMNGPKEPWGQAPVVARSSGGWGEESAIPKNGGGWGGEEAMKREAAGNWSGGGGEWSKQPPRNVMPQPNIRSSPSSWDEPSVGNSNDSPGWGNPKNDLSKSKEVIWNSKQFRILCDMGFRKDEIESTLRATNLRLEDALEMLNPSRRLPNSHLDPPYGAEHERGSFAGLPFGQEPQPGMGSMGAASLPHNPPLPPHKMTPNMVPPVAANVIQQQRQPSSSQQPSAQQLRILVHQIQMAVQAGHLNPQILNQPLAPQTLILLNQLLQQIKHLQSLQQQHSMAPRGNSSSQALMNVTVSITKTKQHIQNLQNQISAQQANYLKTVPQSHNQQPSAPETTSTVQEMFNGMNLMGGDGPTTSNGSRLAQWKLPKEFPKAPGTAKTSSANLLLDNGPWGRGSETNGGWPEPNKGSMESDFGIPEFEPGKPWKGTGMKNPDEDPNLTPGSVAALPIGPLSKAVSVSPNNTDAGMTSPTNTWAFGNSKSDVPKAQQHQTGSSWQLGGMNGPGGGGGSNNLTQIGQDLWGGKSSAGRPPPGMTANSNISPWPQSSNNGWTSDSGSCGSAWLLLKNLTPQIDGSTLKTLCMQHGPLQHFDLYLNHSIALVMYATNREAAKAQKALNNCLLGNTTIHANTTTESDISAILQQLGVSTQQQSNGDGTPSRGSTPSNSIRSKSNEMWSDGSGGGGNNHQQQQQQGSSLFASGSVWGAPDTASSLHSFLPGDLVDNM